MWISAHISGDEWCRIDFSSEDTRVIYQEKERGGNFKGTLFHQGFPKE